MMIARPKSDTLSTQRSIIITSTTTQGRGAMIKLNFSNFNISSVVGREAVLLASPKANKKRKRGLENESKSEGNKIYCLKNGLSL